MISIPDIGAYCKMTHVTRYTDILDTQHNSIDMQVELGYTYHIAEIKEEACYKQY